MTDLYIREYARQARDADGNVMPAGEEPAIASHSIDFTSSSVPSSVLNAKTTFVRIWSTGNCWVDFGTDPTAAAGDIPLEAATAEYFGISYGQGASIKLAAIDRS